MGKPECSVNEKQIMNQNVKSILLSSIAFSVLFSLIAWACAVISPEMMDRLVKITESKITTNVTIRGRIIDASIVLGIGVGLLTGFILGILYTFRRIKTTTEPESSPNVAR